MPVDWSKYPRNWKAIALAVKSEAGWLCQQCQRPCRPTGTKWDNFLPTLPVEWLAEAVKPQRFTLTVAHLDHDTRNNATVNLKALCSACHLRYDAALHAANAKVTRENKNKTNELPNPPSA